MFTCLFLLGLSIILQSLYLAQYLDKSTKILVFLRYLFAALVGGLTCWMAVKEMLEPYFLVAAFAVFLSLATGVVYRWQQLVKEVVT